MGSPDWRFPLNMTLGFHLLVLLAAMVLPDIFHQRSKIPESYTVDLVNISLPEPAPAAPPPQAPPKATASTPTPPPEPVVPKEAISIAPPEPAPAPTPAPAKVVSLRPLKKKIKKKISSSQRTSESKRKRQARQRNLQKELAQARRAEEQAAQASREALDALKQMLHTSKTSTTKPTRGNSGAQKNLTALEGQYYSRIFSHIQPYWALPDIKQWDPELLAVVVVTIKKDGSITNHFFEKRSGDRLFDQFVSKTLAAASPFPKIPAALKRQQWEIGLRFKPGSIQ
ncbi:MAG: energy transducer TonB [Thermodesulfobacteriota bacterium]